VNAYGIGFRGAHSEIIPNHGDELECEECGMCIDICPVGALTSGTYRYKTRPWELTYTGTVCNHCGDGCKTTLGVRNNVIIRANNREEFVAAAERIRKLLASPEILSRREANLDQVIVEAYIPGREVAVEGLLTDGQLRVLAIFDKPDPLEGPYFEETIYVTPSRLSPSSLRDVERCALDAVRALGLTQGPVHAEFRINEQGVWPLEVAPRPIGGLCARALRFQHPEDGDLVGLEELLLRHAVDLPGADWPRESKAAGVMMIPVPRSGILEKVDGDDQARAIAGVSEIQITARLHDYIAAWPEGSTYLGFLFSRAESPEEAESALRAAHAKLRFTIAPRLAVEHPATRGMIT